MDSGSAWALLEPGWQAAFDQAWLAYRNGSFPVGAALIGSDGFGLSQELSRLSTFRDPQAADLVTALEEAWPLIT